MITRAAHHLDELSAPGVVTSLRSPRPRVLLVTEGTYPYVLGGVSSWCHQLLQRLPEVDWTVLPLVAGTPVRSRVFEPPDNVTVCDPIELWSLHRPPRSQPSLTTDGGIAESLPAQLLHGLFTWDADPLELVEVLVWCHENPRLVRRAFRSATSWRRYHVALGSLLTDDIATLDEPLDHFDAATLYQALYWVARTAAVRTPPCDLVHVTAAGWAAIPAAVHRAVTGTPVLLTEHGLYMRESYLATILEGAPAGERFIRIRLARGLTRLSYATSDHVAPVSEFNARWEVGHDVPAARITVVPNGVMPATPTPLPGQRTVVSVGRIDPLKDVLTMLRVAAEVVRRRPDVRFVHHGPVSPGQEAYGRACLLLHERLGLGDSFQFRGPTRHADDAVRAGDVALLTSISEGMPLAVLEAMAQARPVVATAVGGVSEVVRGCGLLAPPGHVERLSSAVCTLVDQPALAQVLALRGRARVARRFRSAAQVDAYRVLITQMTGTSLRDAA